MSNLQKVPIYIRWSKRVYNSLYDFFKYRIRVTNKNVILVGGANPLAHQIVKEFQGNWRVFNLDFQINDMVKDNILIDKDKLVNNNYLNDLNIQIKKFNLKFDSIIFIPFQNQLQDNLCDQFQQDMQNILLPSILAGYLAKKFSSNNAILIQIGCENSYNKTIDQILNDDEDSNKNELQSIKQNENIKIEQNEQQKIKQNEQQNQLLLSYTSIMNAVHMIGVNLNADDEMPTDLTITTAINPFKSQIYSFKCNEQNQKHQQFANILRQWSDGYQRPHSNSIAQFILNKETNKLYWQFI